MNRQYAQSLGRFMQADPYRASGYMADPQSWNRYSYVQNDAINFIDPTGEFRYNPPPTIMPGGPSPTRPGTAAPWRRDDVGGGGGAGRVAPKTRVRQFFDTKQGKKCAEFLNDPKHPFRPSADWVEHVATYANWVDTTARGLKKKTFAELKTSPPDGSTRFNDTVSSWLGPGPAPNGIVYSAWTEFSGSTWEAFIGANYANATPWQQSIIAVHESLHMATHFDDAGLSTLLGINVSRGQTPRKPLVISWRRYVQWVILILHQRNR
jgi:hypothetical protein